jgi:uncharacterized membrane protein
MQNTGRSLRRIRVAVPLLGLAGMGISGYLTYIHYQGSSAVCVAGMKCDTVLTSPYSQIWGIPLSLLGLLMYLFLTLMGVWLLREKSELQEFISVSIYAAALAGTVFTAYLYYLEIFEIHAFCTWCVGSSIVMVALLILSLINLLNTGLTFQNVPRLLRVSIRRYIQW